MPHSTPSQLFAIACPDIPHAARLFDILTSNPPAEVDAWLRFGERLAAGEPWPEAERTFWDEIKLIRVTH